MKLMQKKIAQLAKLQFNGDFLPFALRQSLMKLTPGGRKWQLIYTNSTIIPHTSWCFSIQSG
jgi:hypothetical protein